MESRTGQSFQLQLTSQMNQIGSGWNQSGPTRNPVWPQINPVWSLTNPVRSQMRPFRSKKKPDRSQMEPDRSQKKPIPFLGRRRRKRTASELMKELTKLAASFIKEIDDKELRMQQIVRELQEIVEEVKKKETKNFRAVIVGGISCVGGAIAGLFTGWLTIPIAGAGAVAVGNAIKQHLEHKEESVKRVKQLRREFLEILERLRKKLQKINQTCEELNEELNQEELNEKSDQEELNKESDQEELNKESDQEELNKESDQEELNKESDQEELNKESDQEELNKESDQEELNKESDQEELNEKSDQEKSLVSELGRKSEKFLSAVRDEVKFLKAAGLPEMSEEKPDSIIRSADRLQKIIDEFHEMKKELNVFRGEN